MPYPTPPNPGTVVPSGSLITPSGTMGAQGPTGPTGVSANAGNLAQLGTDNLVLVPQNTIVGLSKYYGVDTGTSIALVVSVNTDFQLVKGVVVWVVPATTCGASPTLNVNGTGPVSIVNRASIALAANEIWQGKMIGMVYDGSSWRIITPLIKYVSLTNAGNITIECAGYDSVSIYQVFTTNTALSMTLAHLGLGIPVQVWLSNGSGGAVNWNLNWTNLAGTAGQTFWIFTNSLAAAIAGIRIDSSNTQAIASASNMLLVGGITGGTLTFL